jgi:hypothetical protein
MVWGSEISRLATCITKRSTAVLQTSTRRIKEYQIAGRAQALSPARPGNEDRSQLRGFAE